VGYLKLAESPEWEPLVHLSDQFVEVLDRNLDSKLNPLMSHFCRQNRSVITPHKGDVRFSR
jgi:hypothetical protein